MPTGIGCENHNPLLGAKPPETTKPHAPAYDTPSVVLAPNPKSEAVKWRFLAVELSLGEGFFFPHRDLIDQPAQRDAYPDCISQADPE